VELKAKEASFDVRAKEEILAYKGRK